MSLEINKEPDIMKDTAQKHSNDSLHVFPSWTSSDEDLIHEPTINAYIKLLFNKQDELEDELTKLLLSPRSEEIIKKRQETEDELSDVRKYIKVFNESLDFEDLAEPNNLVTKEPSKMNNKAIGSRLVNIKGEDIAYDGRLDTYQFTSKLKSIKNYPRWLEEFKEFLGAHNFDDITELSNETIISPAENHVLMKILKSTIQDPKMAYFLKSVNSAIILLNKIDKKYHKTFTMPFREILWKDISLNKNSINLEKQLSDASVLIKLDIHFGILKKYAITDLRKRTNKYVIELIQLEHGNPYNIDALSFLGYIEETINEEIKEDLERGIKPIEKGKPFATSKVSNTLRQNQEKCPLPYQVPVVYTNRSMCYKEAIAKNTNMEERKLFQEAYKKELRNLKRMLVFDIKAGIPRNQVNGEKIIPVKTIFTVEQDGTHKARIVCRGDQQTPSTYGDISTALLDMDTLKLLLMIANNSKMVIQTLDINNAFLYADLKEVIYIPHPYEPKKVVQLNKALYGLKQSMKKWNDHLRKYLNSCALYDTEYTPGLFMNKEKTIIIAVHVSNCIIAANNKMTLKKFINNLKETFELKIVGTMEKGILKTNFLGMDLYYDIKKGEISLSLETYLKGIENDWIDELKYINFDNCPHWSSYNNKNKVIPTLSEARKKEITKKLRIMSGIINYIMTRCRYDIAFAANKLARIVNSPDEQSIKIAQKILKYLLTTKNQRLIYRRETVSKPIINIVIDASLGTEWDFKSRIGVMVWYGRNLYKVISRATTSIRASSTEAELDAIYEGFQEGRLLKRVLEKLIISNNININIFIDLKPNVQFLKKDYRSKKRDKFLDLKLAKLSEQVRRGIIVIENISGIFNVANILTIPVTTNQFKKLIECLENNLNPEDIVHITELKESESKNKEKMLMIS
ncbi:Tkp4 protein [Vanderwaltozyma polyspora DSM 70294]|uniref:Tkp4 protein n=1 Tax=Vanderwaltozyma polyspora (strain ATCC 22028 / DSM 70294 / BCRC 21397 / CBS 2163 / NBRC 10782 / NRRL Y-8283 / UCD 57-17) TaxID=436907 RepID=A7TRJ4_VANPO|nr:Tkp4 protein [Vanderwaltozyma polyspora DSM 70294]EDO15123.1 Tkp4 protein [Vanderwaltozyma polyspora DSM 70294]